MRRASRDAIALLLVLAGNAFVTPPSARAQAPAEALAALLDRPPLDRNLWGIAVLDAEGRLIWGRNPERLFTPASNAKLVVTAAAIALLGPDWTTRTSVYPGGPFTDGVVHGDLVLYGRGDPTWTHRCYALDTLPAGICDADSYEPLARLVSRLKARGVHTVQGNVVGDGSYFESTTIHPSWENDDLVWGYAAPVSGLGFHENTVTVTIAPGPQPGAAALVTVEPVLPEPEIIVTAVTVPDGAPARVELVREGWRVVVSGTVSRSATPRREAIAVPDGNQFAASAFRQVLVDSGITVSGGAEAAPDSLATAPARQGEPLAEVESRPLRDWIFPVLNVSQNWYAEMLLKQLGRVLGGGGGWEEGLAVERRFLIDSVGIDSTQFLLHDGSGLSTKNLISPLALARLLAFMRSHPRFVAFAAGIPLNGHPGSLRHRFTDRTIRGTIRAKTGSIGQVNTLSGYVETGPELSLPTRPPRLVFSIQANHHTLGGRVMIQAIDSLVTEIARLPVPRRP